MAEVGRRVHRLTSVGGEAGPGWREAWGWQLRLWTPSVWGKERGGGKATVTSPMGEAVFCGVYGGLVSPCPRGTAALRSPGRDFNGAECGDVASGTPDGRGVEGAADTAAG